MYEEIRQKNLKVKSQGIIDEVTNVSINGILIQYDERT
jgi:hypothetical protein